MLLGVLFASLNTVSVADFGAKPNSTDDATISVARAIAAAKANTTIEFPAGDYHFYRDHGFERDLYLSNSDNVNPRRIAILIEKRKHLRLAGKGAHLIFHDRVIPFAIVQSEDISLSGFTVDWQRPLMSQATVRASDHTGLTLDIDAARYPYRMQARLGGPLDVGRSSSHLCGPANPGRRMGSGRQLTLSVRNMP